ncbi:DUF4249 domain-containing protein [Fibrella sp. HMF5335]|uniref:DUF4249 domain-containing protein n=1 Tax=Fibrella rubiginis TaxID=2817060 RepID=A0A939GES4_9BACT|nr:DUF4249 domain-containing protein [Fibrella rubiginis]MBO0935475.1 DUF4249 domain-containing protein [Fibrella rubiginis]
MKSLFYLLPVLLITACTNLKTEVNPSMLNDQSEKIVVNSYISPQDTLLKVKVSRSKPAVSGAAVVPPFNVNNATVSLSDGSRSILFTYNNTAEYYQAKATLLPIQTGKTYTLTVTSADGKQVTAQSTVPNQVPISSISLDSTISSTSTEWQKSFRVHFTWQDPTAETNYYMYCGYFAWNSKIAPTANGKVKSTVPAVAPLPFITQATTDNLICDNLQQGGALSTQSADVVTLTINKQEANAAEAIKHLSVGKSLPGARLTLRLANTDAFFYTYTSAVLRQKQAGTNPFAEPVPIPTNVKGGLGCFAAYNRTEKVLLLK